MKLKIVEINSVWTVVQIIKKHLIIARLRVRYKEKGKMIKWVKNYMRKYKNLGTDFVENERKMVCV